MSNKLPILSARLHAVSASTASSSVSHGLDVEDSNSTSVSLYENRIPGFVEPELVRLYGHYYSSLSHMESENKTIGASTYVEYQGRRCIAVILFRKIGNTAIVLNEVIVFDPIILERFARYLFRKYPDLSVLQLCAVQSDLQASSLPHLEFNYLEDIVIHLPSTNDEYHNSIGKNMRRNLRRYEKKFDSLYPNACFTVSTDQDIDISDLRQIVGLNHARMQQKNKQSLISEREIAVLEKEITSSGLMCVVKVEGKVIAGALCFRTGSNYFLTVIAHDSAYDACSLGTLCCVRTIHESIRRGATEFHFLWGRYDYKYLLGGVQRDLDRILIFRSRLYPFMHPLFITQWWIRAMKRRSYLYLHALKKERPKWGLMVDQFVQWMRRA